MTDIVQSVDRTLSILEVISEYSEGLGITEISSKIDLHKSTVHRLLATLIYKGYVVQDPETSKYMITLKLFEIGNKKIESIDILNISKPYLKELMDKTKEVIHLVIRDGSDIVYIDKVESDNTIRMVSRIGKRSPIYCTSVGKAMLAFLPNDEVKKIWDGSKIEKLTEYTITDISDMKKELSLIRQRGFAIDEQENELGVRCIGAPVFNHKGEVEGAISISGPTIRVTKERVPEFADILIKHCKLISKELGYRG